MHRRFLFFREPISMRPRTAFTLIELLVVVAIVALLIAILLPSLNKARLQAKRAVCLSNARSIGSSLHAYMQEWNTLIPFDAPSSPNFWVLRLVPYGNVEKVRQCPATYPVEAALADAPGSASSPWTFAGTNPAIGTGCYGLNGWFYTTNGASPDLFTKPLLLSPPPAVPEFWTFPVTRNEAEIPMLGDCTSSLAMPRASDAPPAAPLYLQLGPGTLKSDQLQRFAIARHGKAVNLAFADGHAETIPLPQLWTLRWHAQWSRTLPAALP